MREALARTHHDVTIYDRTPPRGRKPGARTKASAARGNRRWGPILFGFCALTLAGGVVGNALLMQTGQHPAPLFGRGPAAPAPQAGAQRAAAPEARTPPLPPSRPAPPVADAPAAVVPEPVAAPTTAARVKDAIGDLIRGGGSARPAAPAAEARPVASTAVAAAPATGPVAAAQRALTKLGYGPLKVDGMTGPGTRAAIEKFERDKGLQASGELGPRTAKALAAASGIAIE